MTEITKEIVAEHGLSEDEYQELLRVLGRVPNLTYRGALGDLWPR